VQRDIDLLRKLLLEIELRGASSPIDALSCDARHDGQERIRYHIRLLVDAGLLKEAGQISVGVPCVRLTHEGLEFIELARSDVRWSTAKAAVRTATGGVPFATLKALLAHRAWRLVVRNERRLTRVRGQRQRYVERAEPSIWLDTPAVEPDGLWDDDQARFVRPRAVIGSERIPPAWDSELYGDLAAELAEFPSTAPLPDNLV
jgi:hypothetical protein